MTAHYVDVKARVQTVDGNTYTYENVDTFRPSDGFIELRMREGKDKLVTMIIPMRCIDTAVCESTHKQEEAPNTKSENDAFNEGLDAILKTRNSRRVYNPYSELQQPKLHAAFIYGVSRGLEEL